MGCFHRAHLRDQIAVTGNAVAVALGQLALTLRQHPLPIDGSGGRALGHGHRTIGQRRSGLAKPAGIPGDEIKGAPHLRRQKHPLGGTAATRLPRASGIEEERADPLLGRPRGRKPEDRQLHLGAIGLRSAEWTGEPGALIAVGRQGVVLTGLPTQRRGFLICQRPRAEGTDQGQNRQRRQCPAEPVGPHPCARGHGRPSPTTAPSNPWCA